MTPKTSNLLEVKLFVGLMIDSQFAKELESANSHLVTMFTTGGNYLERVSFDRKEYLGKFAPFPLHLNDLESLQKNITSLIHRIVPHHPLGPFEVIGMNQESI